MQKKSKKSFLKLSAVTASFIITSNLLAAPQGGNVVSGNATIDTNGATTNINQNTAKATINWNSFNVAANETVNFNQPSASSVTLNRVIGTSGSIIEGMLNANGHIFLVNPNGVIFTKGSQVNVGGIVASTLNITDENFNNGNYIFEGNSQSSIINKGTITTTDEGFVALLGKNAINEGVIKAKMGNVQMASGERISLNLNGNSMVSLTIDKGQLDSLIENKGAIIADGGTVYLTTKAIDEVLNGMVNNTGIIQAQTIGENEKGEIVLFAHGGTGTFNGTLDASAPVNGDGGFIETSGRKVDIKDSLDIKAKDWLIDPNNIEIVLDAKDNLNETGGNPFLYETHQDTSVLKASSILTKIDAGTSVTVATSTGGANSQDGDIRLSTDITTGAMTSDATLTLNAHNDIIFSDGIDIDATQNGNVNKLSIVLNSDIDSDGSGNIVLEGATGNVIKTNNGNLDFNGKVESKVANETPLSIDAGTGTVTFDDDVGETNALASIDITASYADFSTKAQEVTTSGSQTYNTQIRLLDDMAQFTNASFEDDGVNSVTATGWTIANSNVEMNGGTTIGTFVTPNDTLHPNIVPDPDFDPNTDPGKGGKTPDPDNDANVPYDGYALNSPMTYSSTIVADADAGSGSQSLKLTSSSGNVERGYAVVRGSSVISDSGVDLTDGQSISFKWKAEGGSDAYDVFGYILNTATGDTQVILNETGASASVATNWATSTVQASAAGTYKFVFVSGSWDATGGKALGAQLFIDDIKVYGSTAFKGSSLDFQNTVHTSGNEFKVVSPSIAFGSTIEGTGTVTVVSANEVTLPATTAAKLKHLGTGILTATNASNNIDFLEVGVSTGDRAGKIDFINSDAFNIKSIYSSGAISLATLTGDITVAGNIDTTDTTNAAVTLNAGKSADAGTSTGGNIVRSGTPTVTVGAGGRATLYTGSIAGSTGVLDFMEAPDQRRGNSDETTATYSPVLGTGNYIVYREEDPNAPEPASEPEPDTTPTPVKEIISNVGSQIIVPIKNNFTKFVKAVAPKGLIKRAGGVKIVPKTDGKTVVRKTTMKELQEKQKAKTGALPQALRVSLAPDSFVELINGGVRLPIGVSQEFYVVEDDS